MGRILYEEVKLATGTQFYSKSKLAALGNPYAVRWPTNYLMDDRIINKQSGNLYRSIRRTTILSSKGATISVWSNALYAKQLIEGNKLARPRPFFNLAWENSKKRMDAAQRQFLNEVVNDK